MTKAPRNAAIVTTTFYKDDQEGTVRKGLARDFISDVLEEGYSVFVVDGSPTDTFRKELNAIGVNVYEETQHGLGPSRREAMSHAYDVAIREGLEYLVWSEPEKGSFASQISNVLESADNKRADIIVPARMSLSGYPTAQINSEGFGNQRHTDNGYLDVDGQPLDTFFGPKAWRTELTKYFQIFGGSEVSRSLAEMRMEKMIKDYKLSTPLPSDLINFEYKKAQVDLLRMDHAIQMPVCLAILNGLRVLSVPVKYDHPPIQTKLEEGHPGVYNMKRMSQLTSLNEQFELVKYAHSKGLLKVD